VTLASIQAQSHQDWECLIVDDGSPDQTEAVAQSWVAGDRRFSYFRKENGGLSSARNFGLQCARGSFIQFLDSDDVILPDKLQCQLRQLAGRPEHSLSFCDYSRGGVGDIYAPLASPAPYRPPVLGEATSIYELAADWETRLAIPPHCFLFNRAFFDEGIDFDETLANHEDWDCWMRIFARAEWIGYLAQKLVIYRYHPESMCRDLVKMKEGYLQAIDKQLQSAALSRQVKAILRVKREEVRLAYERRLFEQPAVMQLANVCYRFYRKIFSNG
jgi:hypothetical protein